MQNKTAPPREHLTSEQVTDLLVGQGVTRGFGLELWNPDAGAWEDISADCRGFTVAHDNTAEVHWKLTAELARELPWGVAMVRAFRRLSKNGVTARFNRGVYVLTTPITNRGRTPLLYKVTGYDPNQRLTRHVGDTYVVEANGSTTYFQALRQMLTDSGLGGEPRLDGTRQDQVIPRDLVWGISASTRWLDIGNDLLAEIAYVDLWHDHDGVPRSEPVRPLEERGVEHVFDTSDTATDLLGADRSEEYDAWSAPNVWTFVGRNWPTKPVDGNGVYIFRNETDGLSSIASVGENPVTHWLDIADHALLVAEGDRIIEADRRRERRFTVSSDPLPIAGHRDIVELRDGGTHKLMVSSWEEPTSGKGTWVLGGGQGGKSPERREEQTTATVTQASPLRILLDGATVDCPANALTDDSGSVPTYDVNTRVTVTVRNPQPPLVQGKETS